MNGNPRPSSPWLASFGLAATLLLAGCGGSADSVVSATAPPANVVAPPSAGSSGLGDPLFPRLGNGGYQVEHYTVALQVQGTGQSFRGSCAIEAVAQQSLSEFSLDLRGLEVEMVTVNGAPAKFSRLPFPKLVIVPAQPLPQGQAFEVVVRYSGTPLAYFTPFAPTEVGWIRFDEGSFVLAQPDGASSWMPVNDHPSDKASYRFEIEVDAPLVVAANGELQEVRNPGSARPTYVWESPEPMVSYLATVNIGTYVRRESPPAGGVPIRNYFPADLAEQAETEFALTGEMMTFCTGVFGAYPFSVYGGLMIDAETDGVALETQTLSIYGRDLLGQPYLEEVQVHELAHQWFGDWVSLRSWRDIWLNEGFATLAEWLWIEQTQGEEAMQARVHSVYDYLREHPQEHPVALPTARDLFSANVYFRGGLTLYALRGELGDSTFRQGIRTYLELHGGGHATTAQFVAVMEAVSGRDLTEFFDRWLYAVELPDLRFTVAAQAPLGREALGCRHRKI